MTAYIIIDDNVFQLSKNTTYSIGIDGDIHLAVHENIIINVSDEIVEFNQTICKSGTHNFIVEGHLVILLILKNKKFVLLEESKCFIGISENSDIRTNLEVECYIDEKEIICNQSFFVNGKRKENRNDIFDNDIIVLELGLVLSKVKNFLYIEYLEDIKFNLKTLDTTTEHSLRFDEFHRSPRIVLREPDEKIQILTPPTEEDVHNQSLLKIIIMPLTMVLFTLMSYFLFSSGTMIFMMMGMSLVTIIVSVHSYFTDKKRQKEIVKNKLSNYMQYLDTKYEELFHLAEAQKKSLNYHYPSIVKVLGMAEKVDRRIYEKTPYHFDFLTYKIGEGEVKPSFQIQYQQTELTKYNADIVKKIEELLNHYRFIEQCPLKNDILHAPVGYIGNRNIVIEQIQQLMIQIAMFHSYHDVVFVPIFREEELPLWRWSRWLPHMKIKEFNTRTFVYNQKTRDQILTILFQVIKDRKQNEQQQNSKETKYTPHYVFVITDLSLMLDHNIMEYINEDLTHLGISMIFTEEVIESLPEHVKTVINFKGESKARFILQNGEFIDKEFLPLSKLSNELKENFATNIAAITHIQTLRNAIPESITFLDLYGVEKIEDLNIKNRWYKNEAHKSLAVPIGLRGRDDILYLNLHEKAHGPHGLIAGTTGSGKSEFVQTYILSLAVNFHPYEVAFLLIDYKGGGMANLFSKLPHLVGTITNLDASQSQRALISIKAELKRRQKLFADNDVNHINQYSKLFKLNKVNEPLPHLFIISDEFAELKAEQPEFMKELVSTARIGRSLGIHLILATQKPSGVVDDQIWSNAKFKVALKVQDAADSREIIKTSDAAEITLPGRAYLQVGNNEVYELFQSAYSGKEYVADDTEFSNKDETIYEIRENGQYEIIHQDLSGLEKRKNIKSLPTELDVIVELLNNSFGDKKVKSPWLPPLENCLYAQKFLNTSFESLWNQKNELVAFIGLEDTPETQSQQIYALNFNKTGHTLVVGSPGFGKTTFIHSVCLDLMRRNQPDKLHFFLYDFGTNGLIGLSDFPHIRDYFNVDEDEKILKSLKILNNEIKYRKKLLADTRTTTIEQYNEISNNFVNHIVIAIDSFDGVVETTYFEEFNSTLNQISREGAALGIYIITTLTRLNAMRIQLQNNFKTKMSLFLFEKSDLSGIIGKTNVVLEDIKGRVIINKETPTYMQLFYPYEAITYKEYLSMMKTECKTMNSAWTKERPKPIPMLPDLIDENFIKQYNCENQFVLGLFKESVELASFVLDKSIALISDNQNAIKHYTNIIEYHFDKLKEDYKFLVIDPNQKLTIKQKNVQYLIGNNQIYNAIQSLVQNMKERIEKQIYNYSKWIIVVSDISAFASISRISENDYKLLLSEASKYGITLVVVSQYNDANGYDNYAKITKQFIQQIFIGMRISDQDYIKHGYVNGEAYTKFDEGYIVNDSGYSFVKLLQFQENKHV